MAEAADILARAGASAAEDLEFLVEAKERARGRVKADPSTDNLAAFGKAKAALDAELARLDTAKAGGSTEAFPNLKAVENYLVAAGWKIGKSKLYKDKDKKLLKRQPDGSVLKTDADAYAALYLAAADAAPEADTDGMLKLKRELQEEELLLARQKRERQTLRLEKERGELIPREEVDMVLVAAVSTYRAGLKQWIYSRLPELVDLVRGDPKMIEEAIHWMLGEANVLFQGFSRTRAMDVLGVESDDDAEHEDDGEDGPSPATSSTPRRPL